MSARKRPNRKPIGYLLKKGYNEVRYFEYLYDDGRPGKAWYVHKLGTPELVRLFDIATSAIAAIEAAAFKDLDPERFEP